MITYNKQEPASEDLEQAAQDYRNKTEFQYPNQLQPAYEGFKAGAQWQREQMKKDAIDTRIDKKLADMIGYTGSERVKVIIIKE